MYLKEATVTDKLGMHARPASMLNKMCIQYKAKIKIHFGEKVIEPRSILSIMAAAITVGSVVTVIGDGEDEIEAVDAIAHFINTYSE